MRKFYLLILSAFFLFGCPPEDDSVVDLSEDEPWERQFTYGNLTINGEAVLANEQSVTNLLITDFVCYDDLPSTNFETFSVNIYVPSHTNEDYQSGFIEREWVIFFDDIVTNDIYMNGTVMFIEKIEIRDVIYSRFSMAGSYTSNNPITRDNFQQMRLDFDLAYKDENGEVFYTDPRTVVINIDSCQ
jgi:hypothetical protein